MEAAVTSGRVKDAGGALVRSGAVTEDGWGAGGETAEEAAGTSAGAGATVGLAGAEDADIVQVNTKNVLSCRK